MNLRQRSISRTANQPVSRRHALSTLGLQAAAAPLLSGFAVRAAGAADTLQPLNRFPRMVQEFFVRQVRAAEQQNVAQLKKLTTRAEAERHIESVRRRITSSFGPLPDRTPLNARVTGVVQRDGYRIEKVIFDSRPGFPVTANLYVPTENDLPAPAVVGTCGHSTNGKAAEAYRAFSQGLVKLGYVCLIYDPIGQGERLQYVNDDLTSEIGVGVREHLQGGNQQFLVGDFLGTWRAWDGIRALDYLLTRDEVDPHRVGVTGNSGGGTMTTWLTGLERRWAMSAPSCFVTTFRRNLENELPADTEQCPPRAIALGLDHYDFLVAHAPKPVIILAKERDFFDVRGSEEAYKRLKHLYRLLGAEDNVALFVGPTTHGYSEENREAMYSWFSQASGLTTSSTELAKSQLDGVLTATGEMPYVAEPDLTIESDETLWCTPQGQVASLPSTKSLFHFTRDRSIQFAATRATLRGADLKRSVRDVLKIPHELGSVPDYRNWRYLGSRGYPSEYAMSYTVTTEPDVFAIVYRLTSDRWHSRPPRSGREAILYVAHLSSDEELRSEPLIGELIESQPDAAFFSVDVRGIGESMPGTTSPGSFHTPYGSDYFYAIHSLMLDRPYVGQKTFDVLRVIQWLESLGHTDVHLVGRGWGALPATFAAVLSDQVNQVTLKNALTSYADIAETEHYRWPLSCLLPNVLARFDLPDCYQALADKKLRQLESWDAKGEVVATGSR